jgi:hypothetical protein
LECPSELLNGSAGVRHEAVSLCALIVMITKVSIFHSGVGVLAGDSVDFRAVTTLDAVEFEAARDPFDLQVSAVNTDGDISLRARIRA